MRKHVSESGRLKKQARTIQERQLTAASAESLALRLHAEMAHDAAFSLELADALVQAGITSRDQLAIMGPQQLEIRLRALPDHPTRALWFNSTPKVMDHLLAAARGYPLDSFSEQWPRDQIVAAMQALNEAVIRDNPGVAVIPSEMLLSPVSRYEAVAQMQALMQEVGIHDLAGLAPFHIQGTHVFEPGYYFARPASERLTSLFAHLEQSPLLRDGGQLEILPEMIRIAPRNASTRSVVQEAVIFAPLVTYASDGQLIIGREISAFTIVADEIHFSQLNLITYEGRLEAPPSQPPMIPERAPTGTPNNDRNNYAPNGGNRGRFGGKGSDGQDGIPGFNGDHMGKAPKVTIWVKRTPKGLPNINLQGRPGGRGQPGQHGGHGGDGARGRPADSYRIWCQRGNGQGGDGGAGGDGGDGGTGGTGGGGGTLEVHTLQENFDDLWSHQQHFLTVTGGPGGAGGDAGMWGEGGRGGAPGEWYWPCDENPDRVGDDGPHGAIGNSGATGSEGQVGGFSVMAHEQHEWENLFDQPWIGRLTPAQGGEGATISISGRNITHDAKVLFNGNLCACVPYPETNVATFVIPTQLQGGMHSIQLRTGTDAYRYSNIANYRVIPHLESLTPDGGIPGTKITVKGTGFSPGAFVRIGEASYPAHYEHWTTIAITLPDRDTSSLTPGIKHVQVVNPDGQVSNTLPFMFTLDIIVRVKTWRVVPDIWLDGGLGFGTPGPGRTDADIRELFETSPTPTEIWAKHHIMLSFDQTVGTAIMPAYMADSWPIDNDDASPEQLQWLRAENDAAIMAKDAQGNYLHFDPGAVNFYFVDDIDDATAHAYTYRGCMSDDSGCTQPRRQGYIIFEDTPLLSHAEEAHVAAHELGHVFGLPHICGQESSVTFGRECSESSDRAYLMYPKTTLVHTIGDALSAGEVQIAQRVAALWHKL